MNQFKHLFSVERSCSALLPKRHLQQAYRPITKHHVLLIVFAIPNMAMHARSLPLAGGSRTTPVVSPSFPVALLSLGRRWSGRPVVNGGGVTRKCGGRPHLTHRLQSGLRPVLLNLPRSKKVSTRLVINFLLKKTTSVTRELNRCGRF